MSDHKRPQLAPEVLDQPSTKSTGSKAGTDKERSFAADNTLVSTEQVHQPKPKAVARPIVEVSPNANISPVDAQNAEPVREPLPRPVARPIVEVVAGIPNSDTQNAEPVREPLPRPVARPIVEVVAGIPNSDTQKAEPVREPLPRPVARPIVEVVADVPHVDAQNEENEELVGANPNGYKVKK
jgi:hypothetical protein